MVCYRIVKNLYFPIDDAKEDVVTTTATRISRGVMSGLFESSSGKLCYSGNLLIIL